jgi:hypothetical protein
MNVRMILASATLTAVTAAGPAACATTEHPAAPTSTTTKPTSGKPVVTKKPPPPAPTSSRQLHYTEPRNIPVQASCDANGDAFNVKPNTAQARAVAAEMCNNLQVGADRAGW